MARIKIEEIIDHMDNEMKRSLEDAVGRCLPSATIDRTQLFREFRRAVRRKCNTWENVPDQYVEM